MDAGLLLDLRDGNQKAVTEWVEGAPERKWYGLVTRGKRKLTVETWRCSRCHLLESYAPG
ncbi:hypothetical protein [Croceibacterium aestuarii]|uniref:hypothetical protein n=1 Tax=Croceibacterium aestuarii TaxID=3064139 RepID=UPI00272EE076|nr:hypothetical protein [Croceibacterium sp. D39]